MGGAVGGPRSMTGAESSVSSDSDISGVCPERSEGSGTCAAQILRCAQDDSKRKGRHRSRVPPFRAPAQRAISARSRQRRSNQLRHGCRSGSRVEGDEELTHLSSILVLSRARIVRTTCETRKSFLLASLRDRRHVSGATPHGALMSTRRNFLKWSAAMSGAIGLNPLLDRVSGLSPPPTAHSPLRPVEKAPASLNILILGGTGFTGPEQVEYAIARGHRVTLFNRGKTRPGMFKGKVAEELIGDLNSDTGALKDKKFDVVIDNPTTLPFWVKNAAQYLKGNTKHYMFISTTSVYADQSEIRINENSPTVPMPAGLDPYQPDQRNERQLEIGR